MDAILDTSLVIEIFKGNASVVKILLSNDTLTYGISAITLFELHCGTLKEKEELFLDSIPKLNFDDKSAKFAGRIYRDLKNKGKIPKVKDLLIASSAIANSKILFTADIDFEVFRDYGLKLEMVGES
jgi:hypothetical protein